MRDDPQALSHSAGDPTLQEFGWRNTPRINFAPERRLFPFSPLIALFAVILVIEILAALTFYGRLQDAQTEALTATDRLVSVERALQQERAATDDVAAKIQDIEEEIKQTEQQSAGAIEIYNRLTQRRPEWAAALQALLQADNIDFRIYSLAANSPAMVGSPAQINLSASASGAHTVGIFLDYMETVDDFLELASWNTSLTSEDRIVFEALVSLK